MREKQGSIGELKQKMFDVEVSESQLRKLKILKLIAKCFLVVQSAIVIMLCIGIFRDRETVNSIKWGWLITAIPILYFVSFWIATFRVARNSSHLAFKQLKVILIVIFICNIMPIIIISYRLVAFLFFK